MKFVNGWLLLLSLARILDKNQRVGRPNQSFDWSGFCFYYLPERLSSKDFDLVSLEVWFEFMTRHYEGKDYLFNFVVLSLYSSEGMSDEVDRLTKLPPARGI